ncbi:MAG: hypothetical protein Kow0026_18140 [Oricola sp.]
MTIADSKSPALGSRRGNAGLQARQLSALTSLAVVALSFWNLFVLGGTHTDVSWLLTVGEKVLAGERLYVDVWETNPPFSVLLYLPMAWLGQVTPVPAEVWTKLATVAWAGGFGAFALALAGRLGLLAPRERLVVLPVGLYVLLLFMPATFSQREHFGVASALPMLVLAAWRMSADAARPVGAASVAAAGLGAAVTMIVKPHYALAFLLPYLAAAWSRRSLRVLFGPEVLVAAAATVAYGVFVWAAYPEYLSGIVPLLLDVYLARQPMIDLVFLLDWMQILLGGILVFLMATLAGRRDNPLVWSFAAAALGFYCAYLAMGKGWIYHAMPALALTVLAIGVVAARCWAAAERQPAGRVPAGRIFRVFVLAAGLAGAQTFASWQRFAAPPGLVERLRQVVANPAVAVVSANIGAGHPMARLVNGRWIERTCSDWIVLGRYELGNDPEVDAATRNRIEAHVADAMARKVEAWTATPPDIVFLDAKPTVGGQIVASDPNFAAIYADYAVVFESATMRVALRSGLLPAWQAAFGG